MTHLSLSAFLVFIAASCVDAAEICGQEDQLSEQALGHFIDRESDAAVHLLQLSKEERSRIQVQGSSNKESMGGSLAPLRDGMEDHAKTTAAAASGSKQSQLTESPKREMPTGFPATVMKSNKSQALVTLDPERMVEKSSELQLEALPLHVRNVSHWYFGLHASSGNPLFPQCWKGLFYDSLIFCLVMLPVIIIKIFMHRARANGHEGKLINCMSVKTSLHAGFAFINGWVNVIMVVRYGMFATMMVGNTIMMGVSYVCHQHPDMGNSCPKNLRPVPNYAILISLFMLGSMLYGLIDKKWNSKHENLVFGIIFVVACVADELFISDSYTDLYVYSPLFGCAGAMAVNGGLGGVPWAATGNILKAGYFSSRFLSDRNEADGEQGISQLMVWVCFLCGILMGCSLESEFALMWNILSLACLFYLLGIANPKEDTSAAASATQKETTSDVASQETM